MEENVIHLGASCYWNSSLRSLFINKDEVRLSISQTKLLEILIENLNRRLHSTDLFFAVHEEFDKEFSEKSVRNLVSSLRKKIAPLLIVNVYGGYYLLRKKQDCVDIEFKEYLYEVLDQSTNVIIITDPNKEDNPIIYVNNAFHQLFGYTYEEVKGKNCRFLHKENHEQEGLEKVRNALKREEALSVVLYNYSREDRRIKCELTISPIFDKKTGKIKYFLGVNKEIMN